MPIDTLNSRHLLPHAYSCLWPRWKWVTIITISIPYSQIWDTQFKIVFLLQVLQLLEGKASLYLFASPGCKKWDTCAPEAVLSAAGGKLTDVIGNFYKYGANEPKPNKTGVLAAINDELHSYALTRLSQTLKDTLANK